MKIFSYMIFLIAMSGCFFTQDRLGRPDPNLKPYGAHWIKDRMTTEVRRQDSWACGADNTVHAADYVVFSKEKKAATRLPSDQNDYGPDGRLTKQWEACMRSKGYVYLHQCDARCLYP